MINVISWFMHFLYLDFNNEKLVCKFPAVGNGLNYSYFAFIRNIWHKRSLSIVIWQPEMFWCVKIIWWKSPTLVWQGIFMRTVYIRRHQEASFPSNGCHWRQSLTRSTQLKVMCKLLCYHCQIIKHSKNWLFLKSVYLTSCCMKLIKNSLIYIINDTLLIMWVIWCLPHMTTAVCSIHIFNITIIYILNIFYHVCIVVGHLV